MKTLPQEPEIWEPRARPPWPSCMVQLWTMMCSLGDREAGLAHGVEAVPGFFLDDGATDLALGAFGPGEPVVHGGGAVEGGGAFAGDGDVFLVESVEEGGVVHALDAFEAGEDEG